MRRGIAVSPGVAVGKVYCIHEIFVDQDSKVLADREVTAELARYEAARDSTANDLHALYKKVDAQIGSQEASIFLVHESILRDKPLTNKIRTWIVEERMTAPSALHRMLEEYSSLLAKSKDEYIKERLADVRDVVIRLSVHLSDVLQIDNPEVSGPLIVVADELLPSHVVALGDVDVRGIITQSGSQTSHAAILARSRGIPAVSGVSGIVRQVSTGDTVVVDGRDGHVDINPDSEAVSAYRKLEREFFHLKDTLAGNREEPAVTADGIELELLANINSLADVKGAEAMGASGVGLFRTEYYYLMHPDVPDEEEQVEAYAAIIAASPNRSITIRTLDIGGDKTIPYLGHMHKEANPFMGWRSIRLSFEHPDFFTTQIRAVQRAAALVESSKVKILFPMITTLDELRRVRNMVKRASKQLAERGLDHQSVPIGMMLEVPAAAVMIDAMLDYVDFVSIGSNDLVQYLMAADRDNPKVSHLCQPLSPAVLRVLKNVIQSCVQANTPITLCGEMAGEPSSFLLLLAMGLRSFSMSPAFIPTVKDLATHLSLERSTKVLDHALKLRTTNRIRRYLSEQIGEIAPNLSLFEMG